jgi:hypothetical protein
MEIPSLERIKMKALRFLTADRSPPGATLFDRRLQLLHHPEGQAMQPVDAECMQAGIALAWWFGRELERNYAGDAEAELRQHLDWILSHHPGGVDARTLQQGRRSIKSADAARIVIQKLTEMGYGSLDSLRFVPHPITT